MPRRGVEIASQNYCLNFLSLPTGFHLQPYFNTFHTPTTHIHHIPTHTTLNPIRTTRESRPNAPARGRNRGAKSSANFFQFFTHFSPTLTASHFLPPHRPLK